MKGLTHQRYLHLCIPYRCERSPIAFETILGGTVLQRKGHTQGIYYIDIGSCSCRIANIGRADRRRRDLRSERSGIHRWFAQTARTRCKTAVPYQIRHGREGHMQPGRRRFPGSRRRDPLRQRRIKAGSNGNGYRKSGPVSVRRVPHTFIWRISWR